MARKGKGKRINIFFRFTSGKWKLVCALFATLLTSCDLSEPTDPPGRPIIKAETANLVFRSKSVFKSTLTPFLINVERFTLKEYQSAGDTLRFDNCYDSTTGTATYIIQSRPGEQYKFSLLGKSNIWLNASSLLRIEIRKGKLLQLLLQGESYIETQYPLTVYLSDSVKLRVAGGSNINIRNYMADDPRATISIARGNAKVLRKYKLEPSLNQTILAGTELYHTGETEYGTGDGTGDCNVAKVGSWREGGYFIFDFDLLSEAMTSLCAWYNTKLVYKNKEHINPITLMWPYSTSLDSTLVYLNQVAPYNFTRREDTIYVQ